MNRVLMAGLIIFHLLPHNICFLLFIDLKPIADFSHSFPAAFYKLILFVDGFLKFLHVDPNLAFSLFFCLREAGLVCFNFLLIIADGLLRGRNLLFRDRQSFHLLVRGKAMLRECTVQFRAEPIFLFLQYLTVFFQNSDLRLECRYSPVLVLFVLLCFFNLFYDRIRLRCCRISALPGALPVLKGELPDCLQGCLFCCSVLFILLPLQNKSFLDSLQFVSFLSLGFVQEFSVLFQLPAVLIEPGQL